MSNSYVLLILTALIYAANILVGKVVTAEMPPFTLAFLRFCIALVILLPFGWKQLKENAAIWKKEWKPVLGLSLTGIAFFNALTYFAVANTSSINAGIIEATSPIFSIILGFFLLKERLSSLQLIGVLMSLLGVMWVITKGSLGMLLSLSLNIGDLAMVAAMFSWAVYSVIVKKHMWKFPLYGNVIVLLMIALIIMFPLALTEWEQFKVMQWSLPVVLGLLFVGIFPSVLAFMFWNKAVSDIGPARSSIFLNLIPVFTAVGAVLFLKETMSTLQFIGGLIVLLGVFITTIKKKASVSEDSSVHMES